MRHSNDQNTHQIRGEKVGMSASTYNETILTAIDREYSGRRHAAKILARDAKTSFRTAQNWLQGISAPNGESLIELIASCRSVREAVSRMIAEKRARLERESEYLLRRADEILAEAEQMDLEI